MRQYEDLRVVEIFTVDGAGNQQTGHVIMHADGSPITYDEAVTLIASAQFCDRMQRGTHDQPAATIAPPPIMDL